MNGKLRKILAATLAAVMLATSTCVSASAAGTTTGTYNLPKSNGSISSWQGDKFYSSGNVTVGRNIEYTYRNRAMTFMSARGHNDSTINRYMTVQEKVSNIIDDILHDDNLYNHHLSTNVAGNSWNPTTNDLPIGKFNSTSLQFTTSCVLYNAESTTMGGVNSSVTRVDVLRW